MKCFTRFCCVVFACLIFSSIAQAHSATNSALNNKSLIQLQKNFGQIPLSFEVNVQEDADNLFGSITLQNIVDRLLEDGYAVTKKQVSLPSGAIKTFAEDYIATVNLYTDINVTVPIKLTRNNIAAPEPVIEEPSADEQTSE